MYDSRTLSEFKFLARRYCFLTLCIPSHNDCYIGRIGSVADPSCGAFFVKIVREFGRRNAVLEYIRIILNAEDLFLVTVLQLVMHLGDLFIVCKTFEIIKRELHRMIVCRIAQVFVIGDIDCARQRRLFFCEIDRSVRFTALACCDLDICIVGQFV